MSYPREGGIPGPVPHDSDHSRGPTEKWCRCPEFLKGQSNAKNSVDNNTDSAMQETKSSLLGIMFYFIDIIVEIAYPFG